MDHLHLYQRYDATNASTTNGRETFNAIHDIQKGTITPAGTIVGKITTTKIFTTEASSMPSNAEELPVMQPSMKILLDGMRSFPTISQEVWEKRIGRRAARLKVEAGDVWRSAAGSRLMRDFFNRPDETVDGYAVMASLVKKGANQLLRRRIKVSSVEFEIA
jgi:hypothetical protein